MRTPLKHFLKYLFPLFLFLETSWAQNPGDMPLRQVIAQAQDLIGKGDFAGASPFLDELEIRFQDEK
ncbi:MAG: hypothetical protein VX855_06720, partial [Verrucomicrobiota bacterium]|nr:hypothetical protein [Verrucomicrobiota bacterium]